MSAVANALLTRPDVLDTFSRTVASGWGAASNGLPWLVGSAGSEYSVSSGRGTMDYGGVSTRLARAPLANTDSDLRVDVALAAAPVGSNVDALISSRRSASVSTDYRLTLTFSPGGQITATLFRFVAGVNANLGTVMSATAYAPGSTYRARLRCVGSTVQAKVWAAASPEPGAWGLSVVDTGVISGDQFMLGVVPQPGNTTPDPRVFFDNFTVRMLYPNVRDSFARTVAPGGWGAADSGHGWVLTGTAADFSVSGGKGRIAPTATASSRHALTAFAQYDVDMVCDVDVAQVPTGSFVISSVAARSNSGATDRWRISLTHGTSGLLDAVVQKVVSSSATSVGTLLSAVPFTPGQPWRVRLQCVGATIRAKAWLASTAEPSSWTVSATDSAVPTGTHAGVQVFANTGNTSVDPTVLIDNFSARALRPTVASAGDSFARTVAPGGWGTADSGQAWTVSASATSDFSVASGQARIVHAAANTFRIAYLPYATADADLLCDVGAAQVQTGAVQSTRVCLRSDNAINNGYRVVCEFYPNGNAQFTLQGISTGGGVVGIANSFAVMSYAPGEMFRVRLQCVGTAIRAKVWRVAEAEPAAWSATGIDAAIASGGYVLVQTARATGNTSVDPTLLVANLRVTPLIGGIHDLFARTVASGWGELTSGQLWTCTTSAVASVGGGRGVFAPAANNTVLCSIPAPSADVEVRSTVDIAQVPTGDTISAAIRARAADTSIAPASRYTLNAAFAVGGTVTVVLAWASGTLATLLNAVAYTPGTGLNLRLRCVGSKISAKAWVVGQAEPAWTDVNDTSTVAPGFVTGHCFRNSGNTSTDPSVYFDDFLVVDLSRPLRADTSETGIDPARLPVLV